MKHQIDSFTRIPADKRLCIIAAILGSLWMGPTWSREQGSGQALMTLLGTLWRRSSWVVFPLLPGECPPMKQKLVQLYKYRHGSVWYHQSRSASSSWRAALFGVQPSFSSSVLETCLVTELRKTRTKNAMLDPTFYEVGQNTLADIVKIKKKHSNLHLFRAESECNHFILIGEYSHSLMKGQ